MALPINKVLPDLCEVLARAGRAVVEAPPGAGKTTGVPLALLRDARFGGRIILLEPRRLAARAAAERMAELLGETVGAQVGLRIRDETRVSKATKIEVVTEGVFTRMIQADPDLPGIGTVIFDEFHERALQADLGLALAWEARATLRPDLRLLVMSATLDAGPVAHLLDDAPRITSQGRAFPVDTYWLDRPPEGPLEGQITRLIERAIKTTTGGILVFLPGEREIRRVATAVEQRNLPGIAIRPLYGALPLKDQRAAIAADRTARKIVLATSVAETSLTIDGISTVIDSGLARRQHFDPGKGMGHLVTQPVSRAEADQRRGRAGRTAQGHCFRNWIKAAEGALPAFPPAEIESADLTDLALNLAQWGTAAEDLALLTQPSAGALAAARDVLHMLGAISESGQITQHGRRLLSIPAHPRLGHLIVMGGPPAAELAALLSGRDPDRGGGADLAARLRRMREDDRYGTHRRDAKRLARFAGDAPLELAEALACAYPDRIAQRRPGDQPRFLLSGGRGAVLDGADCLANQPYLVVADLDGSGREALIRRALPLSLSQIEALFADRIDHQRSCLWAPREGRVIARIQERLGALVLRDKAWPNPPAEMRSQAVIDGIGQLGLGALGWSKRAHRLRARIAFAGLFAVDDAALLERLEHWAAPFLEAVNTAKDLAAWDPYPALFASLDWSQRQQLDAAAPEYWTSPIGRRVAIDYTEDGPEVSLRLQEVLGVKAHPKLGPQRLPLRFVLLSPAGRPIQVTQDLPGFWRGSYADVRKDMRARYPKHVWPEDPEAADPTLRAKTRGA